MPGAINSLGIGSGVLTSDIIDKLRANDEDLQIKPIDSKIKLENQKSDAMSLLDSLVTTFKTSVAFLDDDTIYQKRSSNSSDDSVSVNVLDGSELQNFNIKVNSLAQNEVLQSGTFAAKTSTIASGNGTMSLGIDGETFNMDYTSSTTLNDIKTAINDTAGSKVSASILEIASGDYRLIVTSKDTGTDQAIAITDNGNLNAQLVEGDPVGFTNIQTASNSSFDYNGITLERQNNKVTDLFAGVTINLLKDNGNNANISIAQDTTDIKTEMGTLASAYNSLQSQITSMTTSDLNNGKVGIFNGNNDIKNVRREISKIILDVNSDGKSLVNFGLDLSQDGNMSFDETKLNNELSKDAKGLEKFFSGGYKIAVDGSVGDYQDGIFTKLDKRLDAYVGFSGQFTTLSTFFTDNISSLKENRTNAVKLLNSRYDTMTARFVEYDSIISRITQQFSSLKQQIATAVNGNNN